MEELQGSIYLVTNDINDKVYVGQTRAKISKRWKNHLWECRCDEQDKRHFHRAIRKYGPEHFKIELIEKCPIEQLNEREQYWIQCYDSYHNGYNTSIGGEGNRKYNYEEIYNLWKSGLNSQDVCTKIGCNIATVKSALDFYNISHEEIVKHSVVYRKSLNTDNNMVYMLSLVDNTIINRFINVPEAVDYLIEQNIISNDQRSTTRHNIYFCLNNKRRSAVKYRWCYESNYSENMEFKKPLCIDKISEDTLSQIIDLWNTNLTIKEIAKKLSICENSISSYLKENGINTTIIHKKAVLKRRKQINMIDKNTNIIIKTFESATEAAKFVNLNNVETARKRISNCCNNSNHYQTAYNYKWSFTN